MKPHLLSIASLGFVWATSVCSAAETTAAPDLAARAADRDYRISPRDLVEFHIHHQQDTVTRQRVTASGELRLPLIGTTKLAGLTVREAERQLEQAYRTGGFYVAPEVVLSIEKYRERYVSVLGEVKNPDRVEFPMESDTVGILHAVARVGGFTRIARIDAVQILRTGTDGQQERITLNLLDFFKSRQPAAGTAEFQLHAGDVVFVPERTF